ncbi:hypothetical protein ACLOJK_037389 [Asimina triloba]
MARFVWPSSNLGGPYPARSDRTWEWKGAAACAAMELERALPKLGKMRPLRQIEEPDGGCCRRSPYHGGVTGCGRRRCCPIDLGPSFNTLAQSARYPHEQMVADDQFEQGELPPDMRKEDRFAREERKRLSGEASRCG